ncbi:hypothetical protein FHY13_003136 [Xanthomonas arboricola]|uniref:hypothetical protein n=1 Tax=Xanthomonas euroxanthea TaxID=2259622 RepID=UPI001607E30B|nr:hypothetical protein [Xanthomonas euroxanthea]MBB3814765.1 hypothetical protein [Xanthomonas euroxanthea]
MHYLLLLITFVALVWGSASIIPTFVRAYDFFPGLTAALLLIFLCTSFWGIAAVYLIDLLSSHHRRNNEFLRNFYKLLYEDLGVMLALAALLWGIFWTAKPAYSLSNIDIACLGLPLYIYAISSAAKAKDQSGMLKVTLGHKAFLIAFPGTLLVASCVALVQIYSGRVPALGSLWIQLSILAGGFSTYVGCKQFAYYVHHRSIKASPTLGRMFRKLRGGRPGIYDLAIQASERFEEGMKIKNSSARRRSQAHGRQEDEKALAAHKAAIGWSRATASG